MLLGRLQGMLGWQLVLAGWAAAVAGPRPVVLAWHL